MKIIFVKDHSPRKKGDTMEAKNRDEKRVAEWYLANNIAKLCECGQGKGTGCADCDKKASENKEAETDINKMNLDQLKAFATEKGITFPANVKKAVLIALIGEADLVDENENGDQGNEPAAE